MSASNNSEIAIIQYDEDKIIDRLSFSEVDYYSRKLSEFLKKYTKNTCIGLLMSHNVYILSIIKSLETLNLPFIFLNNHDYKDDVKEIKIAWILTFENNLDKSLYHDFILFKADYKLNLLKTPELPVNLENIFCVVKTSGSTGKAKYIKVEQHCIKTNADNLRITEKDTIYFGTPLSFDPSLIELLLGLNSQAKLLITSEKTRINPGKLFKTIHEKITVLQIVPSVFLRFTDHQIEKLFNSLRILAFGGESFPSQILHIKKPDNLRIFNLYGITEVSCWATIYELQNDEIEIPLGEPLDEIQLEIRNGNETVLQGEGELYIGSDSRICHIDNETCLKPVYRATGDLVKMIDDKIYYLGRTNDLIKRFGQRINLRTLEEMVFNQIQLINKSVWHQKGSKLLLFIKIKDFPNNSKSKMLDKIRVKLLHGLPQIYYPDFIEILHELPLNDHGKIDKSNLIQIFHNTQTEKNSNLPDNFEHLLMRYFGFNRRQLTDLLEYNFFEIGGNSILALQFLAEFKDSSPGNYSEDLTNYLFTKNLESCLKYLETCKTCKRQFREDSPVFPPKKVREEIKMLVNWKYNFDACVDCSPLIFENRNKLYVAVGSFSHIFAVLDGINGNEISKFILPQPIESTPCLSECKTCLYFGCFDGNLYCVDYMENQIKWYFQTGDRIKASPIIFDNKILFGSYDEHVYALNTDGGLIWKKFVSESVGASALYNEETRSIYVTTINGSCLCLGGNGEILWKFKCKTPIFAPPIFYESEIIFPEVEGILHCLFPVGVEKWRYSCKSHIYPSPIISNDYLYGGCDKGLYTLDISKIPGKHKYLLDSTISTTPCSLNIGQRDFIVTPINSGTIYAIDSKSNDVVSCLKLPAEIFSSPHVHNDQIFVGCRDNHLYSIKMIIDNFA